MILYRKGGLTSKDRDSDDKPYPSVDKGDFAGGNRSYPIPTKEDAIDALRLAGLHNRPDVRSKVYSKFPSLRKSAKKAEGGKADIDKDIMIMMGGETRGGCLNC